MLKMIRFYSPRGVKVERAEGQYVWAVDGKRYLDCHNEHGVAFLGHRNPRVIRRLEEQLGKIIVASPAFDSEIKEEAEKSLEKILSKKFAGFYMLNGGGEAVELALKIARKVTRRKRFISFINAFHGRTMGALAVTWNPRYRERYDPFPWDVSFLPYNSIEAVEMEVDEEVAAVIVEPVQGEGGLTAAKPEFLKAVRDVCSRCGALMIVDEVQSGFGRTGALWAHERAAIQPDIIVIGKALGGGFPVSVTAVRGDVAERLKEGDHGSTFGGNPLACAALVGGVEALFKDDVMAKAAEAGARLRMGLEEVIEEYRNIARRVKGEGLMIGVELRFDPKPVIKALQDEGVLALKSGLTVVRFLPPYLITHEDIEHILRALRKTLKSAK